MNESFRNKVLDVVKSIPKGKTLSYAAVALAAGSPGAARAVGSIMRENTSELIPCHRVVRSDGGLGEYNGLRGKTKEELLREEGAIK